MNSSEPNDDSSKFRLFIDLDIAEALLSYPTKKRERFNEHFRKMKEDLDASHSVEMREEGKRLGVSVFENMSFSYRVKYADRHLDILKMEANE